MKATISTEFDVATLTFDETVRLKPIVSELNRKNDGSWEFDVLWDETTLDSDDVRVAAFFASVVASEMRDCEIDLDDGAHDVVDTIDAARSSRAWGLS